MHGDRAPLVEDCSESKARDIGLHLSLPVRIREQPLDSDLIAVRGIQPYNIFNFRPHFLPAEYAVRPGLYRLPDEF